MEYALKVSDAVKSFRETRLSTLRPVTEFFDYNRISRPADINTATQRISYNTRYFSGNYLLVIIAITIYALVMKLELIFAVAFSVGGYMAIKKWAPETMSVAGQEITRSTLYIVVIGIGAIAFLFSDPFSTLFYIVASSAVLVFGHAALLEPGVESEYSEVEAGNAV